MTRARDELILSHAADYGGRRARRVSPFVLEALDLAGDRRRARSWLAASAGERLAAFAPKEPPAAAATRADRRAARAELRPDRRLPDLPAEVQVRPCRPGAVAPHHSLVYGVGAPPGGPGVPSPSRPRRGDDRGGARSGVRRGLVERRVPHPRARGGPAERRPRRARAASGPISLRRAASSRPMSSASSRSVSTATGSAVAGIESTSKSRRRPSATSDGVAVGGGGVGSVVGRCRRADAAAARHPNG